ncbi:MAG: alpha/beta hydrolase family protein [Opitutales bacterium]
MKIQCLSILLILGSLLPSEGEVLRLELHGPKHEVPIKVYLPDKSNKSTPVVLFSHGLGGSREGSKYLGEHWSKNGYAVVALQHPGSDNSVWQDVPRWKRFKALKEAASQESFMDRVSDVGVVLDYLESSEHSKTHPLRGRVDSSRIAMTGHSFGAVTSQAIMGQQFTRFGEAPFLDERINCVILMSPSQSKHLDKDIAFGSVKLPVLCMTGTRDDSPIRKEVTPESRKEVYAALPDGQAYQVVFYEGKHSIFGDHRKNDPRYHEAILEITTHFLDAYLKEDKGSLQWLRSERARESLATEDTWEWK